MLNYLYLVNPNDFSESARVFMEESFAEIIEILRSKVKEHFQLLSLDLFHHVLLVEGFLEWAHGLATSYVRP